MNFLAHAYLSFDQPAILVGNMISDFVKGKKQYEYAMDIQKGIRLHRSIDSFTDEHLITKEMKKLFMPAYGLYAAVFTDIAYDYFLANDTSEFSSPKVLAQFSNNTYNLLEKQIMITPLIFQQLFPYMKAHDWLYNYRHDEGIQKAFAGMVRRAKYMNESGTAFSIFEDNKALLESYYNEFFPLLKKHADHTLHQLLKAD